MITSNTYKRIFPKVQRVLLSLLDIWGNWGLEKLICETCSLWGSCISSLGLHELWDMLLTALKFLECYIHFKRIWPFPYILISLCYHSDLLIVFFPRYVETEEGVRLREMDHGLGASKHSSGHSCSTHLSSRSRSGLKLTSPGFWSWLSSFFFEFLNFILFIFLYSRFLCYPFYTY